MPEVPELEELNMHNQQWTMTNEKSGLSLIFNGESPFKDGQVENIGRASQRSSNTKSHQKHH